MDDLLELTNQAQATHFWYRGFRQFVAPVLEDLARGRRDLRLVDCGCGVGQNLALLRPYGRAFGFDVAAGGTARARRAGFPVVRADITRIPFPTEHFDLATSFDVMQCLDPDREAVAEIARVLRPGGALVMTVAAFEMLRGDHAFVWDERRRYTPASARRLVEGAGLRVERLTFLFASLLPLMLAVRRTQRLLRPFRGPRRNADIKVPAAPVNTALTWVLGAEASIARRIPMPIGSSLLVVARKGG